MNYYLPIGITCGLGILYCVYFDHKRRNSPGYKDSVRARRERELADKDKDDEIVLPPIDDKTAIEQFFVKEIELGEELIQAGEISRAVKHLSYAVVLCPQPDQLLRYMREVLPTDAYGELVNQITHANKKVMEAKNRSTFSVEEVE